MNNTKDLNLKHRICVIIYNFLVMKLYDFYKKKINNNIKKEN